MTNLRKKRNRTPNRWRSLFILATACWFLATLFGLSPNAHAQTETFKATGWQSLAQNNLEQARLAALDDALQKAVSLAVMAHQPEALTGPKAQVVMADILSRRNQLITSYRVVSEEATQARYRVTVMADIRIDQLTNLLKDPVAVEPPPPVPAIKEKIVVFIYENRFGQVAPAAPSESVGAILADRLKQAGISVTLLKTSPTAFAMTDVFMQTPLFARQALALGRQQQADQVVMGIAAVDNTKGRLTATLFGIAQGEAAATIQLSETVADNNDLANATALRFKLGTEAARQVLANLKAAPPLSNATVDPGIRVKVATSGNLQRLVAFRQALAQLGTVEQVQLVDMTTDAATLSVLGPISAQSLSQSVTRLPLVASVELASENPDGIQINVVLSRY